jgi:hypothetical protein
MKNCWNILGIQPTTNSDEIKKAYRDLVKKYHPDKARSPEKVRHYTIKCAGIIEAYHRALQESAKLVTAPAVNDVRSARSRVASARSSWPAFIFCIVLLWVGLGMLGELLFDFKSGPLTLTTAGATHGFGGNVGMLGCWDDSSG